MKRIMEPLSQMGADITSVNGNGCAPLAINGRLLHGIHYQSPVASAQVKSAILLAGLYAKRRNKGDRTLPLPQPHRADVKSEFGADVRTEDTTAIIQPAEELFAKDIAVPGDISSAAFFLAAGLIIPNSEILIKNVGINPTRDGMIRVCQAPWAAT